MKRYLGYLYLFIFFLFLVDGALPQLQMLLFSGSVPVPGIVLKLVLIFMLAFLLLIHFLNYGTLLWPTRIIVAYALFSAYLLLHFLISITEYPPGYLMFSYNSYYFFLLLFPLGAYAAIDADLLRRWLIIISFPLIALGIAQFITNSPILPVSSADQSFRVYAVEYYGQTRAFSLFNSGFNYGHYLAIIGALCAFNIVRSRGSNRLLYILLFTVVIFSCITTLTRNLYIEFIFTICTALLFLRKPGNGYKRFFDRLTRYLPIIYGMAALAVVAVAQAIALYQSGTSALLKEDSILIRYAQWQYYFKLWSGSGLMKLLFGVGIIQNERFPITEKVLLDNSFLAVGLHIGIVGLALWLVFMWALWRYILAVRQKMPDNAIVLAFASLFSTWVSSGIYNINFVLYAMLAVIVVSISGMEKRDLNRLNTLPI